MTRRLLVLQACAFGFCFPSLTLADEPKNADEVIERYLKAIGGREKLNAVKTMRVTGKFVAGGGVMEAPTIVEHKRPLKVRVEFTYQGMTGMQVFDGETGWFVMPFMGKTDPEKMAEDMKKEMMDQADFDGPLVDYKSKGHQVELTGKEDCDGTPTYKLSVTKKSGDVEYHFLDADSFLPIKVKSKRVISGTEMELEQVLGDYKDVNGIMMPHAIESKGNPMGPITISLEKIETNVPIDDSRFVMPEPAEKPKPSTEPEAAKEPEKKEKP